MKQNSAQTSAAMVKGLAGCMLTRDQTATALNVSPSTVERMRRAGTIPGPVTMGKKLLRWRKADVDAFLTGTWRPEPAK